MRHRVLVTRCRFCLVMICSEGIDKLTFQATHKIIKFTIKTPLQFPKTQRHEISIIDNSLTKKRAGLNRPLTLSLKQSVNYVPGINCYLCAKKTPFFQCPCFFISQQSRLYSARIKRLTSTTEWMAL